MKIKITFLLLVFTLYSSLIIGQGANSESRPKMNIERIHQPFEINGKMDNPVWGSARPIELNYEVSPGDNLPAPQKTYVRALYDDNYIYFGFQCLDSDPDKIRANVTDRDNIFQDDYVIICLDTYNDYQKAYEIALNPYGIKGDLLATRNSEDSSIDLIWYGKAEINEKGWTAEMAIPFSSLQFPNKEQQEWGLHVIRTIPRASRTQVSWVRIDRDIPGFISQSGKLVGIQGIESNGKIELLPYAIGENLGSLSDVNNPNSEFKYDPIKGRIGGGIKFSPTPDLSFDGVINPDFSQIETDAAQISVNTTFSLFYPEKRPFFLTGRELLQTPMYYSRSINNPLAAGRVIGKSGSLSYMYFGAQDRNTVFIVPGEEESNTIPSDIKSFANIGRLRYDFGEENYIGGMVFTRNFSDGHNYLFGFDWNYRFWDNWDFNGEAFYTKTKELNNLEIFNSDREFGSTGYTAAFDGERYSGNGLHAVLSHSQEHYDFYVGFNDFSPTYQTYNGFFTSTGYRQYFMRHGYNFYPEDSFIDRATISAYGAMSINYDGIKKEQVIQPQLNVNLKGQTYVNVSYLLVNDEKFFGVDFKGIHRTMFNLNSRPIDLFSLSFYGSIGKFIYRSSSPSVGTGHNLGASITLKPTSKINLSISYDRARLSSLETGELHYDGNIYRGVGIYQFSPEMFFRLIAQYNSFADNFQFYPLFSYKLNAFTTFYLGATSDYLNYGQDYGITNIAQQYFVKVQYLFGI